MFSVVIATRDRVSLLQGAIEALTAQTLPPAAVIVVDDGSTDGTAEWLTTLEMNGLAVIRTEGVGVSEARNRGLAQVESRWVVFLDDDDVPDPRWLETLGGLADDEAGIVSCAVRYQGSSAESVQSPRNHAELDGRALFLTGAYAAPTQLLRCAGGFMSGLTYAENTELSIRLVRACCDRGLAARHTDQPVLTIRQVDQRRSKTDRHIALERVIEAHSATFEADPSRAARWLSVAGVDAFRSGAHRDARRLLRRAFRAKPSVRAGARVLVSMVPPIGRRAWSTPGVDLEVDA